MKATKIVFDLIKTDAGEVITVKPDKAGKLFKTLSPGKYKVIVEKEDDDLKRLKKYYFKMESSLANHLGMKKTELHEAAKAHVGMKVDEETGKHLYESISRVKDKTLMMQRMYEFQQWAAENFKYTFEPYKE